MKSLGDVLGHPTTDAEIREAVLEEKRTNREAAQAPEELQGPVGQTIENKVSTATGSPKTALQGPVPGEPLEENA